ENLRKQSPGSNGEIGLTEAVQEHIMEGRKYFAVQLTNGARRRDIGSWDTYLHAVVDYAQADIEYNSQGVDS
ncbi:MAG: UTP--glucose-1-phosphate uridylyltransferase, partial [Chthonomonadales bacterium]